MIFVVNGGGRERAGYVTPNASVAFVAINHPPASITPVQATAQTAINWLEYTKVTPIIK